ncbi:hypothetical protein [Novosphingobium colocasiae]|uniref:Glycosyltransferase RgtA/B/C/D-like domain-containing protein n=1 Tax=Novosphingobium colocasiae TaxID=1256513 RepID=A0A918PLF7_9SPHN|nr:hypothetical protein [Novosphingobium colocasiae]GGZ12906.1 hypothetical protein GCM10011614_29990 [Novosphingobium colocasiae]
MIAAAFARGPWYDEFFTLYVSAPRFGWGEALRDHWLADNHPPLFYALARASAWLGDSVPPRRLVNVLITLPAAAAFVLIGRRRPAWRGVLILFAIALASSPVAVFYGAEFRSNYLAFLSSALAVAALVTLAGPDCPPLSRRGGALLCGVLAVAFATHLAATILTGGIALAFVAARVVRRDWGGAIRLALLCALASLPLLVSLALQLGRIEANTRVFWIPAGLTAARWAIQQQVEMNLTANLTVTACGVIGLGLLALSRQNPADQARWNAAIIVLAGLAFGTAVLMALHIWRPIVINRYLVAMGPPLLLAFAIGAQTLLERLRAAPVRSVLVAAMAASALWSIWTTWRHALVEPSFMGTGHAIAALVRACPTTVVHADMQWNEPVMALPPPDNRAVMPMAYAMTARTLDFTLEPPASRRVSPTCPTVFWTEHVADVQVTAEALARSLRQRGFDVRALELKRIGRGWIAVSRPGR